jgi:diguanylate cyclase (GGDEF)-like protein
MIVENSIKEILKGCVVPPMEHRIIRQNGSLVWIRNTIVPYYDENGMLIKYGGLIEDITERKQLENKLERLATIDELTQVYNRTKFQEVIKSELERAKRYNHPLSMLMFDIDHFKAINDTYGHSVGDYVLQTLAQIAKENLREIDYLVRWGGEEFIIIAPETDLGRAKALAERIRTAIENYRFDQTGKITISFGVTEFKENDTEDTFIRRADDAMYKAKEKGRNRVEVNV